MKKKTFYLMPLEFLLSNLCYGLIAFVFFTAFIPFYLFTFILLLTEGFSFYANNSMTLQEAWIAIGPLVLFSGFITGSATMVAALTGIEQRRVSSNRKTGIMLTGFVIGNLSIVMLYRYVNTIIESLGGILPADFLIYGELFCIVTFLILVVIPMLANLHIFLVYLRITDKGKATTRLSENLTMIG